MKMLLKMLIGQIALVNIKKSNTSKIILALGNLSVTYHICCLPRLFGLCSLASKVAEIYI